MANHEWQPAPKKSRADNLGKSYNKSACQPVPHVVLWVWNVDTLFLLTLYLQAGAEMSCHDTMLSVSKFETQSCLWKQTLSGPLSFSVRHVGKRCHFSPPSPNPAPRRHVNARHMVRVCLSFRHLFHLGARFNVRENAANKHGAGNVSCLQALALSAPIRPRFQLVKPAYMSAGRYHGTGN